MRVRASELRDDRIDVRVRLDPHAEQLAHDGRVERMVIFGEGAAQSLYLFGRLRLVRITRADAGHRAGCAPKSGVDEHRLTHANVYLYILQ